MSVLWFTPNGKVWGGYADPRSLTMDNFYPQYTVHKNSWNVITKQIAANIVVS